MEVCTYSCLHIGSQTYRQVCMYAGMQVCKCASMQVCKYASLYVNPNIQVCTCMQVCKYIRRCCCMSAVAEFFTSDTFTNDGIQCVSFSLKRFVQYLSNKKTLAFQHICSQDYDLLNFQTHSKIICQKIILYHLQTKLHNVIFGQKLIFTLEETISPS